MISSEKRAFSRSEVEVPLQFTIPKTEELTVTRLCNFCRGGIYFESHLPLVPDCETTVVMADLLSGTPTMHTFTGYRVRIRWCNELKILQDYKYGIGAQFLEKIEELTKAKSLESNSTYDFCDRLIFGGSVCRIRSNGCLCLPCYKHLDGLPPGLARDSILRYIDRNII